jgi:hypothetical protein
MSHKKAQESRILSEEKQKEKNSKTLEYVIMVVGGIGLIISILFIINRVSTPSGVLVIPDLITRLELSSVEIISALMLGYPVIKNVILKTRTE